MSILDKAAAGVTAKVAGWCIGIAAAMLLLLGLSVWLNVRQYGTIRTAETACKAQMVEAARLASEDERKRAAKADAEAGRIAQDTKDDTRAATGKAQESTHARDTRIQAVRTTGACRMPDGLPRLAEAVDAANAAAGD